ncbi:MAG: carboxypeptidase [Saprospirales bacterium]|nr:MAG: carboxypeptidase [Saprospirales bacterium]
MKLNFLFYSFCIYCFTFCSSILFSQDRSLPVDTTVMTTHTIQIGGETVDYIATVGMQPVWDDKDEVVASLHYTYYQRTGIDKPQYRPILISFNGGPGSASVWMHIGYTGPRFLKIDEEGFPIQPFGLVDNPHSVLDVADILFVNPVNTGYSRIVGDNVDREKFFGVNADIRYLADWINTFMSRNNRWLSPKFLIGESYGTTRVAGLANELQGRQWMYLNGVVLVSPTGLGIKRDGPVDIANRIPYYAATAWYHNRLEDSLQQLDLYEVLELAEAFAINDLLPALIPGGFIEEGKRKEMAREMSRYSGISKEDYLDHNLDLGYHAFWKLLLKDEGMTVGRLDSRYKGLDRMNAGLRPDYNAELTAWLQAFTPAINYYFSQELDFVTDIKYNMFGPVHPWDRSNDNTGENLRQAMAINPFLNVMFQVGYYDGATTYFNAKYTMWQMDPSGRLKDRLRFEGYRSGHMMYLRHEDLELSNRHLRDFILNSIPEEGQPAKY